MLVLCHSDRRAGKRGAGSGPVEPLLRFFQARGARRIFLIEQPHPAQWLDLHCTLEVWEDGQLAAVHVCRRGSWFYDVPPDRREGRTYKRLKLRDLVAAAHFFRLIRREYLKGERIALAIGVESLNTLVAHWFRRSLGIDRLVYYIFDWALRRYGDSRLSDVFLLLDRWACERADVIWNISAAVEEARRGLPQFAAAKLGRQLTVPYGAEFRGDKVKPLAKLEPLKAVFAGGLFTDNGAQHLVELARVLAAERAPVELIVAGDGPLRAELATRAAELGLSNLNFVGHIQDHDQLDDLLCQCAIGLAPYPDTLTSTKKYGDVIKIRTYFACGLVVITTPVPPVAREIVAEELGLVVAEDAAAMAGAVLRLSRNREFLERCRENVIRKARQHSWDIIYTRTLRQMGAAD